MPRVYCAIFWILATAKKRQCACDFPQPRFATRLRKSCERLLKGLAVMDSKRVINNSIALFMVDIGGKILPLVTFPWIVRALGPVSYGKVGFAFAVTGFFGLLASPGFMAFGIREAARETEAPRTLTQKLMSARMLLALCSYTLLFVFTFTLAPKDWMTRVLLLISGTNFVVSAFDVQWLFIGHSRMWRVSYAAISGQVIYAAVILGFVRKPGDAWLVPVATTCSLIVTAVLLLHRARRDFDIGLPKFVPEEWAKFLPICATLGVASMMSMIYDQIDTIMLRYLRSEAEVGIYAASYRLMGISMSFLPVLAQVFYPLFSGEAVRGAKNERRYAQWMADASIALALPIATGGFLLAAPISRFVLGARYGGSENLLRWLMLNLISASMAVLFGSRLIPQGRERAYLVCVAAGGVTNVALNFYFIPQYGAMAAVFTTIAAQSVVAGMAYFFGRDLMHADFRKPFAVSVPASLVMAASILMTERIVQVHVVVLVAGGAVVYGLCFLAAQAIWRRFVPVAPTQAIAAGSGE